MPDSGYRIAPAEGDHPLAMIDAVLKLLTR
jgi:hypothetical protein